MSLQNIIITYNIKVICVLGSANLGSFVYIKHIPGETIQAENIWLLMVARVPIRLLQLVN